jgi:murein DD-endopeptidase MepM/ murein hydrolase activator NlpD
MRALLKFLLLLIVLGAVVVGGAWIWAGRMAGPVIEIRQPDKFIGRTSSLDVSLTAPQGRFSRVEIGIEQNGKTHPVFTLEQPTRANVTQDTADRFFVMRPIGKQAIPELQPGQARIVVSASRPVLYGLRQAESTATRDVQVRLDPPRVEIRSTLHYVNHGGAELVVYRATPADVTSGVRVGDQTYPGFEASAAGIRGDDALRVAFFALLYDQELTTPIEVFARDPAGNETAVPLDHQAFPKPFARSRIVIDDKFLKQVVPPIAAAAPDMQLSTAPQDLLTSFLKINGEMRRRNAQTIAELAGKTAHMMFWKDAFQPLGNAAVEARFADYRTYLYGGKEVDQQVHLGFDLAVVAHVPVMAAHNGIVLHAGDLGIYGNCVILDHGLGVQSLYGHLSSIDVKPGDMVNKGQLLGRSGMTGLAAGDHLHFTMLVNGHPVNPVEWWDPKWMQDRVLRKVMDTGGV